MVDANIYDDEWTDGTDEPGFRNRERKLARGAVVAFPTGPGGGHDVRCSGAEAARVLMLSTVSDPEICIYPDREKVGASAGFARTVGARVRLLNGETAKLEYFDGER